MQQGIRTSRYSGFKILGIPSDRGKVTPQAKPPDIMELEVRAVMVEENGLPPENMESGVWSVMIATAGLFRERLEQVLSKKEWEVMIQTLYKRKDRKVKLVNVGLQGGINPGGVMSGENRVKGERKSGKVIPRGSCLTPEQLLGMQIGTGFLLDAEKKLFIDILYEYKGAIAFEDSEMGLLDPSIKPPVVIHMVPHTP